MRYSKGDILVPKGKQYPDCAVVVDGYDQRGRLVMHPIGGGLETHLTALSAGVFRLVSEDERVGTLFRSTRFVLSDSEAVFEGWTDGRLWNGWAMPRFEKGEAERLVRWLGEGQGRYDGAQDAFVTRAHCGEDEIWRAETVIISDGSAVKVYPIGAGSWVWDEAGESEAKGGI
jgi:hypothetical protein